MRKGEQTRQAILDAAVELASRDGLEGLTIGTLAERVGLSKSGVFAHFGSREDLQIAALQEYGRRFVEGVLRPALKERRGVPRLRRLLDEWLGWQRKAALPGGCLFFAGAMEYDDRPGPVRDEIVQALAQWRREIARTIIQAVEAGHLRADTDPEQLAFEFYGVMLALHHEARLFGVPDAAARGRRAIDRLLSAQQPAAAAA
jgi:AcrR family transcriptional regulator